MKAIIVSVLLTVCLDVLHIQRSEAISCYVCTGSTANTASPCLPPLDSSKTCGTGLNITTVTDCVAVVSGCDDCSTEKSSIDGITSYTRSCTEAGSTYLSDKCITADTVTTCYSSCSTNLCNTGSDAPALRLAVHSLLATLCLSTAVASLL